MAVVSLSAFGKRHKLFRNTERLHEPNSFYPQFEAGLLTEKSHIDSFQLGHTKKHTLILSSVFINWP